MLASAANPIIRNIGLIRTMSSASPASISLRGVFPPLTTPFNADESVAWDKLAENVQRLNGTRVAGVLVQGSNGECYSLTTEERVEIVRQVKKNLSPSKLLLAGSGCESTMHTIELSRAMAGAGADCLLVVTPCYFKGKMDGRALAAHYEAVADASPVPVVLYNVPANTGVELGADAVKGLAKHPNIIGMKESNGDVTKIGLLVRQNEGQDFQMMAGSAGFLLGSLAVGAVGGVSALANALPNEVSELQELHEKGDAAGASELQRRLIAPNLAVTGQFGVSGLKRAMEWFGYHGGQARRPLMPLTSEQEEKLRRAFVENGFLKQ